VVSVHATKDHARVEVQLHAFLTSSLGEGDWISSHYGRFTSGKRTFGSSEYDSEWAQSTEKSLTNPEIESRFFRRPDGSPAHYTDWAIVAANLRNVDFVADFNTLSTKS
jgi:hypothetical protein